MKGLWIVVLILSAGACGWLGWRIAEKRKSGPVKMKALPRTEVSSVIEELQKVDPKLIVRAEAGRYSTGLRELRGLAVGPDDRIFAVGDKTLVVLDADGKTLRKTELDAVPNCVAVDVDSTAYVGLRDRVQVVDAAGAKTAAWDVIDKDAWLTSIQVGRDAVYVGDYGRRTVLSFDKAGKLQGKITPADGPNGRFEIPSPFFDVALDPSNGELLVTHTGRRLIERYRDGKLVTAWGKSIPQIDGFSGCCNPTHIALRKDGSVVTAEKGLVRIKIHKPDGTLEGVVAASKDFRKDAKELDLAVDSRDRILVADPDSSTVRVYVAK